MRTRVGRGGGIGPCGGVRRGSARAVGCDDPEEGGVFLFAARAAAVVPRSQNYGAPGSPT